MKIEDFDETKLIKLFGSTSRVRILSLLLNNPGSSFYQREVMFETGQSLQATQRELGNLVQLGIIHRSDEGSKVYYRLNIGCPFVKSLGDILGSASKRKKG